MPELPEVEVVRHGLEPAVTGARVLSVDVLDPRALKRHGGDADNFERWLTGRTLSSAVRRGKFLWFPLAAGAVTERDDAGGPAPEPQALVAHLGMSGQMLLREPGMVDRLTRIAVLLDSPGHGEVQLNFVDQRLFGSLARDVLLPTGDGAPGGWAGRRREDAAVIPSQVAHIARDALDPALDMPALVATIGRKASAIKRVLLDQTVVSGIGNIYADEALWAARIHGETPASRLDPATVEGLLEAVRSVLRRALAEGGTSFDAQYVNVNGASGYFAHSLNAYGQAGRPCPRCGEPIVRESFMNRGSHFCPRCQRA
ncbi:MAG: bifunctional DNA-formamidopyrimidine glycosylase/DNA-(apurinic or apyrimidinic site) lyase [Mycetocola reblochoni]|uniref:Formamidopyrimidine-DNA glycosylase n=1 Tax=Mycetocola reblochoni TaxID=331618 RepID=A0A3L6ZQ90_9MICO|nr:bifunctional DNA-formamidopyrimidine glycosylase/DNA-(apurinic or apyrimidinic site) lyase [Mycetocola reblochoni]RLP70008.1 bifunctional DNA-formamidopyrimidine glycosylase/DNA-(apurinic or apyrimidinic site) lyase [Mycetocola reblochoni]